MVSPPFGIFFSDEEKAEGAVAPSTVITSSAETIHHPGDGEDAPGWAERILHITITPKTAEDMAAEYGFS